MCEKCLELQRAIEFKAIAHERAMEMLDGFQAIGPFASRDEDEWRRAQKRIADRAYAELQDAREKMAEHGREHET